MGRATRFAVAAALLLPVAPARAADTVVAHVARETPVAAADGRVVYSAWDGSAYRLTVLSGGVVSSLPVAGSWEPFVVDLGLGPSGRDVATYARCRPALPGFLKGCDLYQYDFAVGTERPLRAVNTDANEVAGAAWRDRVVFTRAQSNEVGTRTAVYLRSHGTSRRLRGWDAVSLDLRGTRVAFERLWEWGSDPRLMRTDGRTQVLARIGGGAAAANSGEALGPTSWGASVYWMLTVVGDREYSEIHRYNAAAHRDERAEPQIRGEASGFSYDGTAAYYAVAADGGRCFPQSDCPTDIHRADGLTFSPAPPGLTPSG
jgi:hypothetical protein